MIGQPTQTSDWRLMLQITLLCLWAAGSHMSARADFQGSSHLMPFDEDTIAYSKSPDAGPIARLQKRIDAGEARLKPDDDYGYLLALLRDLHELANAGLLEDFLSARTHRAEDATSVVLQ